MAKVILPSGEMRNFVDVVTAAELMVESPNFFLVNGRSLTIGGRFEPLGADEELELGNIYVMYPMKRRRSRVTAADLTILFMGAAADQRRRRTMISSDGDEGGRRRRLSLDGGVDRAFRLMESGDEGQRRRRLSLDSGGGVYGLENKFKCGRSTRPMLDTIKE
ncbi:uncharacterized protein LOC124939312 [Impatiens glandulifera]|uniref:uncharacterized protein LOC124939312 n=1 Tax=Impatiens glandulifera TaxID=253017 RepID=UPI001FB0D793|nr:uncharacterized protein LOC124939312 [Impatiens glandulifera]